MAIYRAIYLQCNDVFLVRERQSGFFVANKQAVSTDNKSKLASQLLYDVEAPKITIKNFCDYTIKPINNGSMCMQR